MLVCLPGCQSGLHALRQGAGGGGFIELVLWSCQRSQYAHCNSTNMTTNYQPVNNCASSYNTQQSGELLLLSGVA